MKKCNSKPGNQKPGGVGTFIFQLD